MNIKDYDGIIIEEVLIPLKAGSLTVDAVTRHVTFTLDLFKNERYDHKDGFDQLVEKLLPAKEDKVVKVYNPKLANVGISYLTITQLGLLELVGENRWSVKLEARGNGAARYVYYITQACPMDVDAKECRDSQIAYMQDRGVRLQLGPLLIRAASWPFMVIMLSKFYLENHIDLVPAFEKQFGMPLEAAREAVAAFMDEVD